MQEENHSNQEKNSAEASLEWKANGHTVQEPGVKPGLSGPQSWGSITTLAALPISLSHILCEGY